MRVALYSTAKSLSEAYKAHRTLEAVRSYYGITVSKGTLSRILNRTEGVSWQAEKEVRRALGMGKRKSYHRPCMDDATFAAWLIFKSSYAPEDGNHERT